MLMKEIERLYNYFLKHPKISTDTRKEVEGTIFFALSGGLFDGNRFAAKALGQGAALVVVDDVASVVPSDDRYFLVENTLTALQDLARFHRRHFSLSIIGITGTNGKTTTKEALTVVLSSEKNLVATQGNFNNHIGVPLTLLRLTSATELAVIEMGANHPGEIRSLCEIAEPTHALVTNIGKAHLEGFGDIEGVIQTKKEIYDYIKEKGGTLFVNKDDNLLMSLSEGLPRFTYGKDTADINAQLINAHPSIHIEWFEGTQKFRIESHLYGRYNFYNLVAAITIGRYFGITPEHICQSLSSWEPRNNRSQNIRTEKNMVIMDAYNANPDSMSVAIADFASNAFNKPVLLLGDMFELGSVAQAEHGSILALVRELGFQDVFLIGKEFNQVAKNTSFKIFVTTDECAFYLQKYPIFDSQILLKGSRGMQLEKLLQYL